MDSVRSILGKLAEGFACEYLDSLGYIIIERNWYSSCGEIDIIARSKDLNTLVFIEVRCRKIGAFVGAVESVSSKKAEKVRKAAELYIYDNKIDMDCRIDVIGISHEKGNMKIVEHIKNAF